VATPLIRRIWLKFKHESKFKKKLSSIFLLPACSTYRNLAIFSLKFESILAIENLKKHKILALVIFKISF